MVSPHIRFAHMVYSQSQEIFRVMVDAEVKSTANRFGAKGSGQAEVI
jgi:hypothetical protein